MRILAIDPSLRSTGFAVLERLAGAKVRALEYGAIKNPAKLLPSSCLAEVIHNYEPVCAAVEAVI